jgi:hypothetical protein
VVPIYRPNRRGRIRCGEHQHAQLQRQPGNRISRAPAKRPGESTGPQFLRTIKPKRTYFCCSAGFSEGFGGLVWFCCGLAGVLGFWSLEAEPGALVIVISFREYLKSIFQVHFEAGAWIGEYKGHAQLYSWNFTIKRFTRRCWCGFRIDHIGWRLDSTRPANLKCRPMKTRAARTTLRDLHRPEQAKRLAAMTRRALKRPLRSALSEFFRCCQRPNYCTHLFGLKS